MSRIIALVQVLSFLFAAVAWGLATEVNSKEAKALVEVKELGGTVTVDEKSPDKSVIGVDFKGTEATDGGLELLKGLARLQSLNLSGTEVTDAGLEHLRGLARFQSLSLSGTKVTDAGLQYLKDLARYDDGKKTFNVEVSARGDGFGFSSPTDEWFLEQDNLPKRAVGCGSDLRAVTSREMLGLFLGLRARHFDNTHRFAEAEPDYLLARYLFPKNRNLYIHQNRISVQCSMNLFEPHEKGHPVELAQWLREVVYVAPWTRKRIHNIQQPQEKCNGNGSIVDAIIQEVIVGGDFL
jgi:hypothetical protein